LEQFAKLLSLWPISLDHRITVEGVIIYMIAGPILRKPNHYPARAVHQAASAKPPIEISEVAYAIRLSRDEFLRNPFD
jgi:hypothetical protein